MSSGPFPSVNCAAPLWWCQIRTKHRNNYLCKLGCLTQFGFCVCHSKTTNLCYAHISTSFTSITASATVLIINEMLCTVKPIDIAVLSVLWVFQFRCVQAIPLFSTGWFAYVIRMKKQTLCHSYCDSLFDMQNRWTKYETKSIYVDSTQRTFAQLKIHIWAFLFWFYQKQRNVRIFLLF